MPQKLIFVPDSFKGSLSAQRVCQLMAQAAEAALPGMPCVSIPIADGGEGTTDAFLAAAGGDRIPCTVTGPWGEPVDACYGRLPGDTAVIEMAAAAGLPLVGHHKNPEKTTTCGVGQLILAALNAGAKEIILGLGGSATNDGGCGAAAALGVRFLDASGVAFTPTGETLHRIAAIDPAPARALLRDKRLRIMCDIRNPLCGPQGAAAVFGPQKGADAAMIRRLDAGLAHLAQIVLRDTGADMALLPGAGAAGGMGGGMAALLGGEMQMGIETLLDAVDFDRLLDDAALVLTGEGRLDSQSLEGKAVIGVSRRCAKKRVPCLALVGSYAGDLAPAYAAGLTAAFPLCAGPCSLAEAMENAEHSLLAAAKNALRLFGAGMQNRKE